MGNVEQAVQYALQTITTCQAAGDPEGEAVGHHYLGHSFERRGAFLDAHDHCQQALNLFQAAGNRIGAAVLLIDVGRISGLLVKPDLARDHLERAERINHEIGSPAGLWNALVSRSELHHVQGEHDAARHTLERAYAISRDLGPHLQAEALNALGAAAHARGDHDQAVVNHDAALALSTEIDDPTKRPKATSAWPRPVTHSPTPPWPARTPKRRSSPARRTRHPRRRRRPSPPVTPASPLVKHHGGGHPLRR
ncbi:tetratricopeptide repeat protein [Nonomuraea sp. NPDC050310]|uniref:tetratricopeptide repeat protein n=1 Tax=Nonomuraea sp. NPDC050310 TaxID=3154935 RepID=UPI003400B13A